MRIFRTVIMMIAAVLLVPVRTEAQHKAVVELHSYLIPNREDASTDIKTQTELTPWTDSEGNTTRFSMRVLDFPIELPAFFSFSLNTGGEQAKFKSGVYDPGMTDLKPGRYKVCATTENNWEGDVSEEMFRRQRYDSADIILKAGKNIIIHLNESTPLAPQLFSERVAQVLAAVGYGPDSGVDIQRFGNFLIIN